MKIFLCLFFHICLLSSITNIANAKDGLQPVTIQLKWLHQFQFAGYYAALHKGFYREEGLDVIIRQGGPHITVDNEVLSGRADFGVLASELIHLRTIGKPLVLLAAIMQHSTRAIIVRTDSGINSPADLIGRRLMINQNEDIEFKAMFIAEGVPYEKLSIMSKDKTADAKFIAGEIDGLNGSIGNQPFIFNSSSISVKTIRPISYGIDFYGDSLFTSEKNADENPEQVKKFRKATIKGWYYAMNNIEEIVDLIIAEFSPDNSREHLLFEAKAMQKLILPDLVDIGHISSHRIERIAQIYADLDLVPTNFSLKGFIFDPAKNNPYLVKIIFFFSLVFIIASIFGVTLLLFNARLKKLVVEQTKELRSSNSLLKAVIEGTTDAIFLKNLNGQYLLVNSATLMAIGRPESEVIGKDDSEIFPAESAKVIKEADLKVLQTGQPKIGEERLETSYGVSYWLASKSPYRDAEGKIIGLIGISSNISEIKQKENEKKLLQEQLIQAQKIESIGQLAGGVAHDFNNMLGVIIGYSDLILEQMDSSQQFHAEFEEIRRAALRSADLTRQLLTFARKQTVAPKVLDLNQTIEGMLNMLRRIIGENINLIWRPGTDLWPIKMDPSQIDQILANLCVNTRDAIAGVGQMIVETQNVTLDDKSCEARATLSGEYVRVTVSDTGQGMDEETLTHIFEPFFTTKGVGEGTGLGLATVYGAVKQNNGFIEASSELGKGATFTIYLARHIEIAAEMQGKGTREPVLHGHEVILLVEDEPTILNMIKTMLERLGYTVLAAGTPIEAIRMADAFSGQIQLLATDVIMPEMNGRDLAKQLIKNRPGMKYLFISGYTDDIIANQGLLKEGMHFIQKPFAQKKLAAKVREVLESCNGQM